MLQILFGQLDAQCIGWIESVLEVGTIHFLCVLMCVYACQALSTMYERHQADNKIQDTTHANGRTFQVASKKRRVSGPISFFFVVVSPHFQCLRQRDSALSRTQQPHIVVVVGTAAQQVRRLLRVLLRGKQDGKSSSRHDRQAAAVVVVQTEPHQRQAAILEAPLQGMLQDPAVTLLQPDARARAERHRGRRRVRDADSGRTRPVVASFSLLQPCWLLDRRPRCSGRLGCCFCY